MGKPAIRLGAAGALAVVALGCAHPPPAQAPEQSEERRLAVAEGWLQGSSVGIGPSVPLILLHDIGGDHHVFDAQIAEFRGGRRVLAFDQRGCGSSSDSPGGRYDLETRVKDLGSVLDAIRFEAVVLVGHGAGAQVVARYAERNPGRVLGLALLDPLSDSVEASRIAGLPGVDFRNALERWFDTLLAGSRPETRERVTASLRVSREPALRAMLADAGGSELAKAVAGYPGPVLVLASPRETLPRDLRAGVVIKRAAGGSHWSPLDVPEEVNAALWELLKPLDEGARRRP